VNQQATMQNVQYIVIIMFTCNNYFDELIVSTLKCMMLANCVKYIT